MNYVTAKKHWEALAEYFEKRFFTVPSEDNFKYFDEASIAPYVFWLLSILSSSVLSCSTFMCNCCSFETKLFCIFVRLDSYLLASDLSAKQTNTKYNIEKQI